MRKQSNAKMLAASARNTGERIREAMRDNPEMDREMALTMGMHTGEEATDHAGLILVRAAGDAKAPFLDQLARRILESTGEKHRSAITQAASAGAERLSANTAEGTGETNPQDETLQELTPNRRERSAHHSKDIAAVMVTHLALPDEMTRDTVRVADYSCGTGTLLVAAADRLAELDRRSGGPARVHTITGADISIPATTLAAERLVNGRLVNGHPEKGAINVLIATMPYGDDGRGNAVAGSLELLMDDGHRPKWTLGENGTSIDMPRECFEPNSQDAVVMNPPCTGPLNHWALATSPMTPDLWQKTAERVSEIGQHTGARGKTGPGYHFSMLAVRDVRTGGRIGLILPTTALAGAGTRPLKNGPGRTAVNGWQNFRDTLLRNFNQVIIVTITEYREDLSSFTWGSGTAEAMIIARKMEPGETPEEGITFVTLDRMPRDTREASETAQEIERAARRARQTGQEPIILSSGKMGHATTVDVKPGRSWSMQRIVDQELFGISAVTAGEEWSGSGRDNPMKISIPMTPLDRLGRLRQGDRKDKTGREWPTTGFQISRNFRFNSSAIPVRISSEREIQWTQVNLYDPDSERAAALYSHTILGLISRWASANRRQNGLGQSTTTQLASMPFLDLTRISEEQVARMSRVFELLDPTKLMPACDAWEDPLRLQLDETVFVEILGMDQDTVRWLNSLRVRWCLEPTVQGHKGGTAPQRNKMARLRRAAEENRVENLRIPL